MRLGVCLKWVMMPLWGSLSVSFVQAQTLPDGFTSEETFLPTFRAGHQLSLTLGLVHTRWSLEQDSGVVSNPNDAIDPINAVGSIPELTFRYAYHINLLGRAGFYVGSSAALSFDTPSYEGRFYAGPGFFFPSITVGLSTHIGTSWRVMSGVEYGAAWYPWMNVKTNGGGTQDLAPVPNIFNVNVVLDYFHSVSQGFSVEVGARRIQTICLDDCSGSVYLNSLDIKGDSLYLKTGITWLVGLP